MLIEAKNSLTIPNCPPSTLTQLKMPEILWNDELKYGLSLNKLFRKNKTSWNQKTGLHSPIACMIEFIGLKREKKYKPILENTMFPFACQLYKSLVNRLSTFVEVWGGSMLFITVGVLMVADEFVSSLVYPTNT